MSKLKVFLLLSALGVASSHAAAEDFNIPGGELKAALDAYVKQSGVTVIYSPQAVSGVRTRGIKGAVPADIALSRILSGTGFSEYHTSQGEVGIVHNASSEAATTAATQFAQAAPVARAVETVTVTSSKLGGADVQSIPIAITALSQEQLTSTQTAGGPDLVKQVPNLTFSKTNFTGYNIQIRGIGTQAISVTTDPAVAVALNDIPFLRNHFFEQEFYDLSQVEVLRGPQGTLYGRNATAGVVNVLPAKPTDQFELMMSADGGNYNNRRFEGMINIPIVDDRLDLRLAGEWTKRDGYSFNSITNQPIDGRDLWSSRASVAVKPFAGLQATLVWEHFQESDDRLRSSKQLCKTDPTEKDIGSVHISGSTGALGGPGYLSQGCLPASLYSPESFQVPNGDSLPYVLALKNVNNRVADLDPYTGTTQSLDLRVIESTLKPVYKAQNDILELNADYQVTPALTLTSQTGYNHDSLYAAEDYNRFNTTPNIFLSKGANDTVVVPDGFNYQQKQAGIFCDPQLGCTSRLVAEDLSQERAWQLSQELRLSSSFPGPFNFSVGGNFLHYETEENYYVFINALTLFSTFVAYSTPGDPWIPGVSDNSQCLTGYQYNDPRLGDTDPVFSCKYIDPNPIDRLNDQGHNYFLSQNPYLLNSYAGFGELYYNVTPELKFIGGLRWTDDQKHFTDIPSEVLVAGIGYPAIGIVDQEWREWTGRAAVNWTPKLHFTDQTLIFGSFAHGYKAGGANPPGAVLLESARSQPVHPLTFAPEFINAYELGTKNTLLDGSLTMNGSVFYYDYKGYQISEIVDRTSVNLNFDATVKGAELEATWEPLPGWKFSFAGGYEDTDVANGSKAVDLMDRTGGHTDWAVVRPFVTSASNCIIPVRVLEYQLTDYPFSLSETCANAYLNHLDPATVQSYILNPTVNGHGDPIPPGAYAGYDPTTAPNNGAGFDKDLSGNELPSAPHFTTSASAEYTLPITGSWAATLHGDFYWQADSFARIFNDQPYDRIRGYTNFNVALILTSSNGWQILGYLKNVFDTTAITGDFLNSDDTGLTTNVFLTDPRLYGLRVTKNF